MRVRGATPLEQPWTKWHAQLTGERLCQKRTLIEAAFAQARGMQRHARDDIDTTGLLAGSFRKQRRERPGKVTAARILEVSDRLGKRASVETRRLVLALGLMRSLVDQQLTARAETNLTICSVRGEREETRRAGGRCEQIDEAAQDPLKHACVSTGLGGSC